MYTKANWTCVSTSTSAPNLFMYGSPTDTVAMISAPNYFLSQYMSLNIGDWIMGFGIDGSFILQVTISVSSSVTVQSFGSNTGIVNSGFSNQLAYYAVAGNSISGLPIVNNAVLTTSILGLPVLTTSLPSGLTIPGYANSGINTNISSMTGLNQYLQSPIGIKDNNGHIMLSFFQNNGPNVNYIQMTNSTTGSGPTLQALGSDTNIYLALLGKGTGGVLIQGTGTNSSAGSGYVGEYISSSVLSGSAVSLTTNVSTNVTSILLTPGDWNVSGNVFLSFTGVNVGAFGWITTTSSTIVDNSLLSGSSYTTSINTIGMPIFNQRLSLSVSTTIYLCGYGSFSTGTCSGSGFIGARRVR